MSLHLSLPRWLLASDVGLGEVLKRSTAAVGVKPCGPCRQRAERLNQMLVFASAGGRKVPAVPRLALPPTQSAAPAKGTALTGGSAPEPQVVRQQDDESTPASDTDRCCAFSVTLINRKIPKPWWWPAQLWPWIEATQVRVTATGGTTILNADPDDWEQVSNFPTSVTWDPGTGGPLPVGDSSDSWIIDNDFLLSLGPVSSGVKTIRIEWLSASGAVLDAFQVGIPCSMGDKDEDSDTDWRQYTSVVTGGKCTSVYLEPDDCDEGAFDYTLDGDIGVGACFCNTASGVNLYDVTYTAPSSPPCSRYEWTVDGVIQSSTTDTLSTTVDPSYHMIGLSGFDSAGNPLLDATPLGADFTPPSPDFTWLLDGCTNIMTLDASITGNPGAVVSWDWTCSESVVIPSGMTTSVDFSAAVLSGGPRVFVITLRVRDGCGCSWSQKYGMMVGGCDSSFTATYSWCVKTIDPGLVSDVTVTFTSNPGGCGPYTYTWSFQDPNASLSQNTSTLPNPTHTYTQVHNGFSCTPTLDIMDNKGCHFRASITLTIAQRQGPQFTVKVCPDGKVVCETNESHPVWNASGSPVIVPWPYTKPKKHRTRIIYYYPTDGIYSVSLTDTDAQGNTCTSEQRFTVKHDCCMRNTSTKKISDPVTVQVNNKSTTLRVKAKLKQSQGPLWHRVIAKSILQKQSSLGYWYRFRSQYVELETSLSGKIYRSEWQPLAFDGSFFKGCRCAIEYDLIAIDLRLSNKRKVRAVAKVGQVYRSRFHSIFSGHQITVNAIDYPMKLLNLGEIPECDEFIWWN